MIASQKIGKSFMGALQYNLNKVIHPDKSKRATILDTNFASADLRIIKQEVDLVRSFRPALNRYVYHTSLNFAKEDVLENKQLLAIAHDYLRKSGYDDNQYFIFRHNDADHLHLHLLVNRIRFDGTVVSDSQNFKKSEAILRELEQQYNLITVEPHIGQSTELNNGRTKNPGNIISKNKRPLKAPTKGELEMMERTGGVSEKLLLQEKLSLLLPSRRISIQEFIERCERHGISLLFNQASTGRVSGITYFHNDFKIRGQALGNRFKWNEILKHIDYEQGRDSAAISAANDRTRAKYGQREPAANIGNGHRIEGLPANDKGTDRKDGYQPAAFAGDHTAAGIDRTGIEEKQSQSPSADLLHRADSHPEFDRLDTALNISISDDVDDEAIYGKDRQRQRKARTNRR
ncbi:relaxase/mobilization nuclease domain-containing protein [Mucilaginibacter defluvii]|uniref:MobA/VirD2-like nuclease domain-containing protein n=1 Tax=Mucilaginibacter defluvii TaxID=1196019 RepID=A0ABP9G3P7_9SPHI